MVETFEMFSLFFIFSGLYQKGYSIFLDKNVEISDQMIALSNHLKLQDEDNKQRQHIVQIIDSIMKRHFPDGAARIFGSSANGLGFKSSDVDIKLEVGSDTYLSKQNNTQIQEDIITAIEKHSEFGAQPEVQRKFDKLSTYTHGHKSRSDSPFME